MHPRSSSSSYFFRQRRIRLRRNTYSYTPRFLFPLPHSAIANPQFPHTTKVQYPRYRRSGSLQLVKQELGQNRTGNPGRKVHIIDDDSSVRRGFKRLLKSYGYDVQVFASAREFLAAGLPGDDSCLVIDVAMPEMNGLQLLEELTKQGCKAPVIFITALNDPEIRNRAKRFGVAAFFQKPVDADVFLDALNGAMSAGATAAAPPAKQDRQGQGSELIS